MSRIRFYKIIVQYVYAPLDKLSAAVAEGFAFDAVVYRIFVEAPLGNTSRTEEGDGYSAQIGIVQIAHPDVDGRLRIPAGQLIATDADAVPNGR